ncbi:MAG: DUF4157 domain-containing protein [Ginsengibacter sp.]
MQFAESGQKITHFLKNEKMQRERFFQPKLTINAPNDIYEQEADAMADKVMRMPANDQSFFSPNPLYVSGVQRKCAHCEKEEKIQRKESNLGSMEDGSTENYIESLNRKGNPLSMEERTFFESRFGHDFSEVQVHTNHEASQSARNVDALAYTHGNNIVFGEGQYNPGTPEGKKLMAHELTHVIQQNGNIQTKLIQRSCDDPNFCLPYPTAAEAVAEKEWLRTYYLPVEEFKFGASSRALYASYLSRKKGDSLAPVIFNDPSSDVVTSFSESSATLDDQDTIMDMVSNRLSSAPGWPLSDFTPTMMSLANFLTPLEMDNRPINYSNPFSIAGHIAGGIGSSDAGPDYRKINYGNVTLEKIPIAGGIGYISVEITLHYEVFDAVDFCPGDCGSGAEQKITIPMSRLEAGGDAYDVPFKVNFIPVSASKRVWY